ncbi:hypothetical protein D3C72_644900 [compost metagenome]
MTDTRFDASLARLHLRHLGQAGRTMALATPHRLADGLAWRLAAGQVDAAPDSHHWAEDEPALFKFAERTAALPGTPDSVRMPLQEARARLDFVDRFGRRHLAAVAARDVSTLRALVIALAPAGEGADVPALAGAIADGCVAAGFVRPLLVEVGDGMDLYFALPPVALDAANRDELARRVRGFERWVADRFARAATDARATVLTGADLHQAVLLWGTPAPGPADAPVRLVRPLEPEAPRREDAALRQFLLSDPGLDAGDEPAAPTEAFQWPTASLEPLRPDAALAGALAFRHPAATAFFGDLQRQRTRARGGAQDFLARVIAGLVGLHALESGVPAERAARALAADARSLKRAYRAWLAIAEPHAHDPEAGWLLEPDPAGWFIEHGLAAIDADPARLVAFLRAEGMLPRDTELRARPAPAPFTPTIVSWEARRAAQAAWLNDRLAEGRPGVYVNNAEPSVSKTAAALAMMAAHPDKRFLYLAPSHALLQDVYRRAIEAGIPETDMVVAQGLERACAYPDMANTVLRDLNLGRDFKARYCDPGGLCGMRASCHWHTQKADAKRARILLAPSAHLAREHHFGFLLAPVWGNDDRHAIIIDEDPTASMGMRRTLDPDRLTGIRELVSALGGAEAYAADLAALIDFVLAFADEAARERATYHGGTEPDDAWRAARRVAKGRLRAIAEDTDESDEVPLLDALLADARSDQGVTIYKDADGLPYTFRSTPALPDKPVFVLDGTAVPAFYRQAFRRQETLTFFQDDAQGAERSYIRPAGRVVQIVDSGNSRTRLKSGRTFDRLVESIRGFVKARRAADPLQRCLLVTYADQPGAPYETRFREALSDLGVEVAHFGAIRGLDGYAGWDTVVVGTFRLHPAAYADEARKTLGVEPADWSLEPITHLVPTLGPRSYEIATDRHRDPALQAVFEQRTLGELVQAIARSRVLVPGHERAMAVVYSNFPLPGLLAEPMTMADFDAAQGVAELPPPAPVDDKALRTTLAKVLATDPTADARRAKDALERALHRRVAPSELARLWAGPEPAAALARDRARHQITQDLSAQGVDMGEAFLLSELWADAAARLAGPFWIDTSRGLVTLKGLGLNRSGQAQVEQLVQRALQLREAAKGRRATSS